MDFDIGVQPTDRQVAVYPLPAGAGCVGVPGTVGYPMGAGAMLSRGAGAASGNYYAIGALMNAIAPFWGQPANVFDQFDWNDPQTAYNAINLFGIAMVQECGVPSNDPNFVKAVGLLGEASGTDPAEFAALVRGLLAQYCPDQLQTPNGTTTTTTPAAEEAKTPWGWIAAGAGVLLVLGGVAIYYATRPTKRKNPSRRRARRASSRRRRRRNPTVTYSGEMPGYALDPREGVLVPIYSEERRQRAARTIASRGRQIVPAYHAVQAGTFDVEPTGRTVRKKNARRKNASKKKAQTTTSTTTTRRVVKRSNRSPAKKTPRAQPRSGPSSRAASRRTRSALRGGTTRSGRASSRRSGGSSRRR